MQEKKKNKPRETTVTCERDHEYRDKTPPEYPKSTILPKKREVKFVQLKPDKNAKY